MTWHGKIPNTLEAHQCCLYKEKRQNSNLIADYMTYWRSLFLAILKPFGLAVGEP